MFLTAEILAEQHHSRKQPAPMRELTYTETERSMMAVMNYLIRENAGLRLTLNRMDSASHGE